MNRMNAEETKMITDLNIGSVLLKVISAVSLLVAALTLLPQTFFIANVLNAFSILLIMAFAMKSGNIKMALIEIPFLLIPLVLIFLGHPLRK